MMAVVSVPIAMVRIVVVPVVMVVIAVVVVVPVLIAIIVPVVVVVVVVVIPIVLLDHPVDHRRRCGVPRDSRQASWAIENPAIGPSRIDCRCCW